MKKFMVIRFAMIIALVLQVNSVRSQSNHTDVPRTLSYQGVISKDGIPVNGNQQITASLFDDAAGTHKIWAQTFEAAVSNGIFNLILGSTENPLPPSNQIGGQLWLGVQIAGDQFQSLSPLTASPYALNVADSAITTSKLASNAVTTEKLAPNSITRDKLNVDYISSLSVNGIPANLNGGTKLNIISGNGLDATWDETSNSLLLGGTGSGGGGMHTMSITTIPNGGTGLGTLPTDGQLLIGSTSGSDYALSTLTAGSGISITNGSGAITITNTSPSSGGTVTSVGVSGGSTGLTTSGGPITSSGTITLGGTLGIGFGGTGQTSASSAFAALSPLSTTGDILFENSTPVPDRLPIGSSGDVLTVSGGVPTWAPVGSGSYIMNQYTQQSSAGFNVSAGAPSVSTDITEATITNDATASIDNGQNKTGLSITNSGTWNAGNVTGLIFHDTGPNGTPPYGSTTDILGTNSTWYIDNLGNAALSSLFLSTPINISNGGTGIDATGVENGQVFIGYNTFTWPPSPGESAGFDLATLTAGSGISITNGTGSITIAESGVVPWERGGTGESNTTASGTFVIGDNSNSASNVYLGGGVTAPSGHPGSGWTLHGQDGNGTDKSGGPITLYTGRSTGSAEGGPITFNVAVASVSGTGLNMGVAPMIFSASGNNLPSATGMLQIGQTGQATGNLILENEADGTGDAGTIKAAALSAAETWSMPAATGTVTVTGAGGGLLTAGTGISITDASATTTISESAGATLQNQPTSTLANSTGTFEFAGLSQTFTPAKSKTFLITVSGSVTNSTVNKGSLIELFFGTGAAPFAGTATTGIGTQIGGEITAIASTLSGAGVSATFPFSIQALVTGLSAAAHWVDLGVANDGGGTSSVSGLSVSVVEF